MLGSSELNHCSNFSIVILYPFFIIGNNIVLVSFWFGRNLEIFRCCKSWFFKLCGISFFFIFQIAFIIKKSSYARYIHVFLNLSNFCFRFFSKNILRMDFIWDYFKCLHHQIGVSWTTVAYNIVCWLLNIP